MTKAVLERALETEIRDHLGYESGDPSGAGSGNSRNGKISKQVHTLQGPVEVTVPRDRNSTFQPVIVPERARRLGKVEDMILSLYARGMTTRDIGSHLEAIYGAKVSAATISRVTDVITDEITQWQNRPEITVDQGVVELLDFLGVRERDGSMRGYEKPYLLGLLIKDIHVVSVHVQGSQVVVLNEELEGKHAPRDKVPGPLGELRPAEGALYPSTTLTTDQPSAGAHKGGLDCAPFPGLGVGYEEGFSPFGFRDRGQAAADRGDQNQVYLSNHGAETMDYTAPVPLSAALHAALDARAVVDSAVALVMVQRGWGRDRALSSMRSVSTQQDRRFSDVARRIIADIPQRERSTATEVPRNDPAGPPRGAC